MPTHSNSSDALDGKCGVAMDIWTFGFELRFPRNLTIKP